MINQEFLTNKRKQLLIATASAGVVTAVLVAFITSGNSKKPVSDVDRILNGDRNKIILQKNPKSIS